MKKIATLFFLSPLLLAFFFTDAQTQVSGGIYSSTTWKKANSPYIVTDTVVVFPGVTLTIEPGVVVKFADSTRLEIRQATLMAVGTKTDSIIFTSNSSKPKPGIWGGLYFNISATLASQLNYCGFYFAYTGISMNGNISIIKNSGFINNIYGASGSAKIIDTCNFIDNTYVGLQLTGVSQVSNCNFLNNKIYGVYCEVKIIKVVNCSVFGSQIGVVLNEDDTLQNCLIRSNQTGIEFDPFPIPFEKSTLITNSTINSNDIGMLDNTGITGNTPGLVINNSIIDSNSIAGVSFRSIDTLLSSEINNNGIGIQMPAQFNFGSVKIASCVIENNSIGIADSISKVNIYCNKICNNTLYNFIYGGTYSTNIHITNNYWCSTDSATIATKIYDGYDNFNLGLAFFMPIDTQKCYLTGCNLQLSVTTVNATCDTCHNGSATVKIVNGISPFTYTWYSSPIQTTATATKLSAANYTVCVVDANGCSACYNGVYIDSTNCTGFSVLTNESNESCITCSDGKAWANVTGGKAPYHYTWYTSPFQSTDSAIGLPHGKYTVCVSDQYGCSVCDSVAVGTGSCSAHFDLYPDTMPHHYLAKNMASGVAPIQYLWSWGDSTYDSIPYPSHTYAAAGFYTICLIITDNVGCTNKYCVSYYLKQGGSAMVSITVLGGNIFTPVNEVSADNSFLVFPNPATNNLSLILPSLNSSPVIRVFNLLGETMFTSSINTRSANIDISKLPNGIYMIEMLSGDRTSRQKFVKE